MRRLLLAVLAAAATASPTLAETGSPLVVRLDQATRVLLSGPIKDVVIANPNVADVAVLDARSLVVMGKAPGATSLLVVDPAGRVLADRQVLVSTSDEGRVSYYRGAGAVRDFACSPRCGQIDAGEAAAKSPTP